MQLKTKKNSLTAIFILSFVLLESCCTNEPVIVFSSDKTIITVGDTIQFINNTSGGGSDAWVFEGGTRVNNSDETPLVVYNTPGVFDVTLLTIYQCNGEQEASKTEPDYITVNPISAGGCGGGNTITDIDGNIYNIVQIGNQCWMKENLKTTHFRDGSVISEKESNAEWSDIYTNYTQTPAWCFYNEDANNNSIYGKLYNWYAVSNSLGICPQGWHIPDENEIFELSNFLGGLNEAGGKMKALSLWDAPNSGASNSSGFSALPGGNRSLDGNFGGSLGYNASFWLSSEIDSAKAVNFSLSAADSLLYVGYYSNKAKGQSCRCIKD